MSQLNYLTLAPPFDTHPHLRQGAAQETIFPYFEESFVGGFPVGNTNPPIATAEDWIRYRDENLALQKNASRRMIIEPMIMLLQRGTSAHHTTTPDTIIQAFRAGCRHAKLIPCAPPNASGNTQSVSNARGGVYDISTRDMQAIFRVMEELGMWLHIHAEMPGIHFREAEIAYMQLCKSWIIQLFRRLQIMFKHVSSAAGARFVLDAPPNVVAEIATHHLELITRDWMDEDTEAIINPDHYCRPPAKTYEDIRTLREIAFSAHPKFCHGSDAAMHPADAKHPKAGQDVSPGVASNLVLIPSLVRRFEAAGALENLSQFVSGNAAAIFELDLSEYAPTTVVRESWTVPDRIAIGNTGTFFRPYKAGEVMEWRVRSA